MTQAKGDVQLGSARSTRKSNATPPQKKRRSSELQGIFPATRPYIGVEATRQQVARQLGEELERKVRER